MIFKKIKVEGSDMILQVDNKQIQQCKSLDCGAMKDLGRGHFMVSVNTDEGVN